MTGREVDNRLSTGKPWDRLKIEASNEGFGRLISLVNQGLDKKDKDGRPINENDAQYMVAIGIWSLRAAIGVKNRFNEYVDPNLIGSAKRLIMDNEENVKKYIDECLENSIISAGKPSYIHRKLQLTASQLNGLVNVMTYAMDPQFSTTH